jgi:hypothetical protein
MNKVVLYIKDADNVYQAVDLFEDETISVTSKIQDIRDISKVFTDFSQSFTIPASKKNNKIFRHFYNYFITDGAFDARKKVDAILEINYIPFREGKVFLNSVKMKNNKAFAYNVTFFGNTVTLKDLFGDDELSQLTYLDQWTHPYGSNDVKTGLTTGVLVSGAPSASVTDIIYPLISHTKRLYFNSDNNHSAHTIAGDLSYHNQNSHSADVALEYTDLKPAIKVTRILEAIEDKYDIEFSGFFDTTPMSNLYLWMSREKGRIGGTGGADNIKTLGTWEDVPIGDDLVSISSDGTELTYIGDTNYERLQFELTITPSSGYTSIPYTIETYVDGLLVSTETNQTGTNTFTIDDGDADIDISPVKYIIKTTEDFNFTPTLTVVAFHDTFTETQNLDCGGEIGSLSQIIITAQLPKIKVIDFLSGILKMFNLIIYYEDDRSDVNFGKIIVKSLDDYYNDNPKLFDITKYVDSSETDIESTIPFSEIDFSYEEGKTLLMKQHKEAFNNDFGDEEFRPADVDRGKPYKVKLPFEHFKFERLIDENNDDITSIQWGYSANDNFKPDSDAEPKPTANYEPILMKPSLFYGIRITGLTSGNGINWNAPHDELFNYWKPSNTNENGTSSVAPAYTLNFDNEIDEWNFTDYGGSTNSLFKKWYKTYIEDAFDAKKRIFKLTAHLPNSILLNYELNDRFQIGDKVFTINSINSNLKTGESKLELLNVL